MILRVPAGYLFTLVFISLSFFSVNAEEFSLGQVSSLQHEYQAQLRQKPRAKRKPHRVKRSRANTASLQQAAQMLLRNNQQKRGSQSQQQRVQHKQMQQRRPVQHTRPQPRQYQLRTLQKVVPQAGSLFAAAKSGNVGMIEKLIRQGINVNKGNNERETALHMAAATGQYQAAIYLINHGANINARTINNWRPIHHATRFRHVNIANYLLQKGASPYARTSDGLSAIDMARANHDKRLLNLFGVK